MLSLRGLGGRGWLSPLLPIWKTGGSPPSTWQTLLKHYICCNEGFLCGFVNSAFLLALLDSLNPCCPFSVTLAPMQLNLDILFRFDSARNLYCGVFKYRIQMGGSQRIFQSPKRSAM